MQILFDLQLWPLIFLQPLDLQERTVPHLKDLIHICFEALLTWFSFARSTLISYHTEAFAKTEVGWTVWSVDICSGFTESGPAKCLFCFVEQLSLYSIIVPCSKEKKKLLQAFRDHIFTPFGCRSIYSDQDPALLLNEFKRFCEQNEVEIRTTKPCCPSSNGMVEKYQSYLQNTIRTYSKTSWDTVKCPKNKQCISKQCILRYILI